MNLEQIQKRIKDVESKFNEVEKKRQETVATVQELVNEQLRLQGEFRTLKDLETELIKK